MVQDVLKNTNPPIVATILYNNLIINRNYTINKIYLLFTRDMRDIVRKLERYKSFVV